jgi:hypothetical protein
MTQKFLNIEECLDTIPTISIELINESGESEGRFVIATNGSIEYHSPHKDEPVISITWLKLARLFKKHEKSKTKSLRLLYTKNGLKFDNDDKTEITEIEALKLTRSDR